MKQVLCLTLTCVLLCTPAIDLSAQTPATGAVSGSVAASSGRRLSGISMQLLDTSGVVVDKTVTSRNGEFSFPRVNYNTYTLQCVANGKVIGTASVTVTAATQPVRMVCTTDVVSYWKKYGVLTALGAAALAGGTAAVVATGRDASGSR
jgi:hypothetical protein